MIIFYVQDHDFQDAKETLYSIPIPSMYCIFFTYSWLIFMVNNVGIYIYTVRPMGIRHGFDGDNFLTA